MYIYTLPCKCDPCNDSTLILYTLDTSIVGVRPVWAEPDSLFPLSSWNDCLCARVMQQGKCVTARLGYLMSAHMQVCVIFHCTVMSVRQCVGVGVHIDPMGDSLDRFVILSNSPGLLFFYPPSNLKYAICSICSLPKFKCFFWSRFCKQGKADGETMCLRLSLITHVEK